MNAISTALMEALRKSLDRLIQGICPTEEYVLVDKKAKGLLTRRAGCRFFINSLIKVSVKKKKSMQA